MAEALQLNEETVTSGRQLIARPASRKEARARIPRPTTIMAARNSFESLGLCEIPLKVPKPGTDFGRAVQQLMQGDANAQRIIAAASELQQRRDRLAAIETLSDMTVDEALSEMLAYDRQLEDLQGRLEVRLPAKCAHSK